MARHQTRYVSLAPLFHTYTRPNLGLFCSRYYIGIGYTSLSIRFFLFSFFFSIDNWTRDLSGRNDLGVLIERELFFLFSNVYDLTTRSRLGLNISIRCYIRRIIHSGKEFSWLVKREEQKTLSQRRVFNPPRISPSMRISYRGEIRKKKDSCHHRHPVNKHGGSPGGIPVNQLRLHPSLPFQFSSLFTLHAINDIPATKP